MRTLKINLLYQCTARCGHCRFGCTQDPAGILDTQTPLAVAKQLKDGPGLEYAVILGGEPSLHTQEVYGLLRELAALGLGTRIETNAIWAPDLTAAKTFLQPLKEIGTQVMLSLDAFHAEYIPPENVAYAVQSCMELKVPYMIETPYLTEDRSHPMDQRTQALVHDLRTLVPDVVLYEGGMLFTGRAAVQYGDACATGKGIPSEPCIAAPWWMNADFATSELVIYEEGGWISKGCGVVLGNVHQQDVVSLLDAFDIHTHPIFSVLVQEGPLGLAKMAQQYGYVLKDSYADKCHLCHEVRQVLQPRFPDMLQPMRHYTIEA